MALKGLIEFIINHCTFTSIVKCGTMTKLDTCASFTSVIIVSKQVTSAIITPRPGAYTDYGIVCSPFNWTRNLSTNHLPEVEVLSKMLRVVMDQAAGAGCNLNQE